MLLPFQRKTYSTSLNVDDAKSAVRAVINERSESFLITSRHFSGSIEGRKFKIQRFPPIMGASIKGEIKDEGPTLVELRSVPSYALLVFLSIFPLVFVPGAFSTDVMTINGVTKVPDMPERLMFALGGGLIPILMFVISSIVDVTRLEKRLKERLGLRLRELSGDKRNTQQR